MAHKLARGAMPCLFCGKAFRNSRALTTHLDLDHKHWVQIVMSRLGLASPVKYPVQEYRRALAEALVAEQLPRFDD